MSSCSLMLRWREASLKWLVIVVVVDEENIASAGDVHSRTSGLTGGVLERLLPHTQLIQPILQQAIGVQYSIIASDTCTPTHTLYSVHATVPPACAAILQHCTVYEDIIRVGGSGQCTCTPVDGEYRRIALAFVFFRRRRRVVAVAVVVVGASFDRYRRVAVLRSCTVIRGHWRRDWIAGPNLQYSGLPWEYEPASTVRVHVPYIQ